MSMHKNVITLCCAAAFALGLAACSSSDDPAPPPPPPPPVDTGPTAYEAGKAAIMAAMTEAEAQMAYDAIDQSMVSGEEAASLMMALSDRQAAIAAAAAYERGKAAIMAATTAAAAQLAYDMVDQTAITGEEAMSLQTLLASRLSTLAMEEREAAQKDALMMAAGMIDTSDLSTQALVDAAQAGIRALRNALDAADDVSQADKDMYQGQLDMAIGLVDAAQGGIDTATRRMNQMDALSTASMALQPALAALAGATPTKAQLDAANNALAALNTALMGAADLTDAETAPYQREADNAMAPIQTAQMAYDDAAEKERMEMEAEAQAEAQAAKNKVAATKKAAIATEADSTTTAARPFDLTTAPADLTAPTDAENYVLNLEHTGSAVEATVLDGALPADNDPMYEQAATFGNGQMLVRNIGTDRKIIVFHSDIEADDKAAFSSRYTLTVDRDTDTTAMDTYALVATDNDKIMSSRFPSGASTTRTFVQYNNDTTAGRTGQFSGSFDGAPGLYRCIATGGTCTVSTNAMGEFNALTVDEWQFTPNPGAMVDVPDEDYLTYGFWLDTTTKDGEIASYDIVQTFATSSLTASTGLTDVTGSATYEGDAAGVYVHETKNDDGSVDVATSGRFTADVELTAYFTSVANRVAGSLEGTISDFELDGGPENMWEVNVSVPTATGVTTADGFSGTANGGVEGSNGSLSGRFHGTGDATDNTVAPPVVVGEFNSTFVNGVVAGAYGARKE